MDTGPTEFGTVNARNLTPWRPGQSGNPSGRPKGGAGFAKAIRNESKDGKELYEFAFAVMRGQTEVKAIVGNMVVNVGPSLKDRMDAMKWLADRGFGRVPESVEDGDTSSEEMARACAVVDSMSVEELKRLVTGEAEPSAPEKESNAELKATLPKVKA